MGNLFIKSGRTRCVPVTMPTVEDSRVGKAFAVEQDGESVIVVCKTVAQHGALFEMTIPDSNGVLHQTGSQLALDSWDGVEDAGSVVLGDAVAVKAWQAALSVLGEEGQPKCKAVAVNQIAGDEKSPIVDYRDVVFEGYLSTFVGTTPKDRDGDYVQDGAFSQTLAKFKANPVMLIDHLNMVGNLAGSFTKVDINSQGLAVQGTVSNAPSLIDVRFKIVEGHLRTLSMGGLFFYLDDGRGIAQVDLYEGSLTPVPANPDAQFSTRSLTFGDAVKAYKRMKF